MVGLRALLSSLKNPSRSTPASLIVFVSLLMVTVGPAHLATRRYLFPFLHPTPQVLVLDGKTGDKLLEVEPVHKGGVYSVAWAPDNNRFITASADKTAIVWDANTGKPLTQIAFGDAIENQQLGALWLVSLLLIIYA